MSAREYLRLTPETVPGTFDIAGTAVIIDIDAANAYTVRPQPMRQTLRTAGAYNRRAATISKKFQFTGNLNWTVRGSQAALIAAWCFPSATTNLLKSYTIDHVIVLEDTASTALYSRHLGMYVQQAQLSASESDQWFKAALQLVGLNKATITVTDFPEPALADYPSDQFLTFEDATGGLTLHAATRLDLESFQLTAINTLDIRYFVGAFPQKIKYTGRDINWTSRVSKSSGVPRVDYETTTPIQAAITFNNGVHGLAFDMKSANYYASVADQLDMSKVYLEEIGMEAHLDYTAASDLVVTAT